MSDSPICYFGFGSLVNRDTRPRNESAQPATLHAWERHWGHKALGFAGDSRACCSLTVKPTERAQASIDGVIVSIDKSDLPELDERETGYDRIELPASIFSLDRQSTSIELLPPTIYMYVSKPENRAGADSEHPILQSYIDCVMAGFETMFGEAGLERLIRSTYGWDGHIENDRKHPRYPRAVTLQDDVLARYDALVKGIRNGQTK